MLQSTPPHLPTRAKMGFTPLVPKAKAKSSVVGKRPGDEAPTQPSRAKVPKSAATPSPVPPTGPPPTKAVGLKPRPPKAPPPAAALEEASAEPDDEGADADIKPLGSASQLRRWPSAQGPATKPIVAAYSKPSKSATPKPLVRAGKSMKIRAQQAAEAMPEVLKEVTPLQGASTNAAAENTKMRRMEALLKQYMDLWFSLPAEKRKESWDMAVNMLAGRMPHEQLEQMALAAGSNGQDTTPADEAPENGDFESHSVEDVQDLQEEAIEEEAEPADEEEEVPDVEDDQTWEEAIEQRDDLFFDVAQRMLENVPAEGADKAMIRDLWKAGIEESVDEVQTLVALMTCYPEWEHASVASGVFVGEVVQRQLVRRAAFEQALATVVARLEEPGVWQTISHVFMHLVPKTASVDWGWGLRAWTWIRWWVFFTKTLAQADGGRAFDIVAYCLQLTQERAGKPIKDLESFADGGFVAKVREHLARIASLDDSSLDDMLDQYGLVL